MAKMMQIKRPLAAGRFQFSKTIDERSEVPPYPPFVLDLVMKMVNTAKVSNQGHQLVDGLVRTTQIAISSAGKNTADRMNSLCKQSSPLVSKFGKSLLNSKRKRNALQPSKDLIALPLRRCVSLTALFKQLARYFIVIVAIADKCMVVVFLNSRGSHLLKGTRS